MYHKRTAITLFEILNVRFVDLYFSRHIHDLLIYNFSDTATGRGGAGVVRIDDPLDPDDTDPHREEYQSGGGGPTGRVGTSDGGAGQQLYIVVGVVLGVVVLVVFVSASICVWKQHFHQRVTGALCYQCV